MNKKNYYLKTVEWSPEDQCYIGSIPGWIGRCCHGDNEQEVYSQLCRILDEWIEIYEKDNIPYKILDLKAQGRAIINLQSKINCLHCIRHIFPPL